MESTIAPLPKFDRDLAGSILRLKGLRCQVRLGCSSQEREVHQPVSFDLAFRFAQLPEGCRTDELSDTICYAEMSDWIRKVCALKEYQLIEKLAFDVFRVLRERMPPRVDLWLEATKERPPVADLIGGTSFSLGDWEP